MGTVITQTLQDMYVEDVQFNAANSEGTAKKIASVLQFFKNNYLHRFDFGAQGPYSTIVSFPVLGHGMTEPFPFNATITNVWVISGVKGTSGTTEADVKHCPVGTSTWTTIFSTTPKFASTSANDDMIDSASVVPTVPTGVTRPILSTTTVNAGDRLRFDLITAMVGASDLSLKVDYKPR